MEDLSYDESYDGQQGRCLGLPKIDEGWKPISQSLNPRSNVAFYTGS